VGKYWGGGWEVGGTSRFREETVALGFHSFTPSPHFNIVGEGWVQESFIIYPDHDLRILRANSFKLNDNNPKSFKL